MEPKALDTLPPPVLHPAIEPSPVAFSYLAPGWWILLLLLIGALYFSIRFIIKNYKRNAYKKQALQTLQSIQSNTPEPYLAILKNTAIKAYGREQVAGLYGNNWIDFLVRSTHNKQSIESIKHFLGNDLYTENRSVNNLEELKNYVTFWIKHHDSRLA